MKKKINVILVFITIIVWIIIIYSISEVFLFNSKDKENEKIIENDFNYNTKKISDLNQNFLFENLEKDPFISNNKSTIQKINKRVQIKSEIKKEISTIKFFVSGVVINGNKKNIVFYDETNTKILFLNEGDIYNDIKVLKITKNQVELLQTNTGNKVVLSIQ